MFATSSVNRRAIKIWDFESENHANVQFELRPENKKMHPLSFDWIRQGNGNALFAASWASTVSVYAQTRKFPLQSFEFKWEVLSAYDNLPFVSEDLACVSNGNIVATGAKQFAVFTQWLQPLSDKTFFNERVPSQLSGALPFYHPKVLLELLVTGMVYFNRQGILRKLRLF